jgi:hypothetical protein
MKSDTLSWNRRGKELGDVSGAAFGVIAHELAHNFGLDDHGSPEDVRERKGNLMGTGMRGFRGAIQPDSTSDSCVLDAHDASILNASKFFKIRDLQTTDSLVNFDRNRRTRCVRLSANDSPNGKDAPWCTLRLRVLKDSFLSRRALYKPFVRNQRLELSAGPGPTGVSEEVGSVLRSTL